MKKKINLPHKKYVHNFDSDAAKKKKIQKWINNLFPKKIIFFTLLLSEWNGFAHKEQVGDHSSGIHEGRSRIGSSWRSSVRETSLETIFRIFIKIVENFFFYFEIIYLFVLWPSRVQKLLRQSEKKKKKNKKIFLT